MRKYTVSLLSLCLLASLALGIPKTVYASDGPQGGTNSGTRPPGPPDTLPSSQTNPPLGTIVLTIVLALAS